MNQNLHNSPNFLNQFTNFQVSTRREGFRERRTLGHLSFWGPTRVWPIWPFVRKAWKCGAPSYVWCPLKNLSFVVPTMVLQLP